MARPGRKRKAGERTKSGRLKRQPSPFDKGNLRVEQLRERFGVHYCWALGRAYASGLIGHEEQALNRYQAAKKFVRLHRLFFGDPAYTCPLDDSPRGGNVVSLHISDQQEKSKEWLMSAIDSMDIAGVRPYFDQLVMQTDTGPPWLDRLLDVVLWNRNLTVLNRQLKAKGASPREPKAFDGRDKIVLDAAIQAMDIIAPEFRPVGIVAQAW